MPHPDLAEAYRATSYIIQAPGGPIPLRVGEPSARLDALLESYRVTEWAFITAWNPGSVLLPPEENRPNNDELLERLRGLGHTPLPGLGVGDDGAWPPEPSFFIPGIGPEEALRLGSLYGQRAIVAGRRGEPPQILWCRLAGSPGDPGNLRRD